MCTHSIHLAGAPDQQSDGYERALKSANTSDTIRVANENRVCAHHLNWQALDGLRGGVKLAGRGLQFPLNPGSFGGKLRRNRRRMPKCKSIVEPSLPPWEPQPPLTSCRPRRSPTRSSII